MFKWYALTESTTLSQRPWDTNVYVNHSAFIHCYASYNPTLDVTYTWYQGNMMIEFERIFRLDETRYEVWINPHFKRVSAQIYLYHRPLR